jgi:hypothetical protein
MPATKGHAAITQLTASGTSTTLDVSGAYGATLLWAHSNGSGTVTVPGSFRVQVKANGGARWVDLTTPVASTTTGATDTGVVALPPDIGSVQLVYVAPTGAVAPTLDAEVATTTGI